MTAQDVFKAMLREHIAPEMRRAGLKGSGQKYRLDLADHFALLGIQRASGSDAEVIRWTANVLAVSRADWSALVAKYPHHGDAPKHNYSYGNWDTRVSLLPTRPTAGGRSVRIKTLPRQVPSRSQQYGSTACPGCWPARRSVPKWPRPEVPGWSGALAAGPN